MKSQTLLNGRGGSDTRDPRGDSGGRFAALGGPTASSWREQSLTRVAEIEDLADAFLIDDQAERRKTLAARIHRHVETARQAADGSVPRRGRWARFKALVGGSPVERTASNLDAAETDLLRLAPDEYFDGQLPGLLAQVQKHLLPRDPRRLEVETLCDPRRMEPLNRRERNAVIAAVRAASSAERRTTTQLRSFRNILYLCAAALTLTVVGLVVLGIARPQLMPLCFKPNDAPVCPTHVGRPIAKNASPEVVDHAIRAAAASWDIALVAITGVIAAAIAAAVALRKLQGTTTPYALPLALAVLKLPTGALTAVLGLLLMRGQFVPGLSALDTPAQIIAWAILFGYAQQLFTRLVDDRAHEVLDKVGGQELPRETLPADGGITRYQPSTAKPSLATSNGAPASHGH